MISRPRLRSHLTVATVDGDTLFIRGGKDRETMLENPAAAKLAPLLDGERTVPEILSALGNTPLPSALSALNALEAMGYLTDGPVDVSTAASFWEAAGQSPQTAVDEIAGRTVCVRAVGGADAAGIAEALGHAGLNVADEAELLVVVAGDYLDEELAEINRERLRSGEPWVLVKPSGTELWIGPHLHPGGPCWACLAERLGGNRQLDRYLARHDTVRLGPRAVPGLASTLLIAAGVLATELQTIMVTQRSPRLEASIVTIDLGDLSTESHAVIHQPQCPACGDPSRAVNPVPVGLSPSPKRHTDVGGHRVEAPGATLERLSKHVSPLTGAVTSLKTHTPVDDGVAYSYTSGHNFAMSHDSLYFLRENMRGRSGGKGRTAIQAQVGAVCEAIERFSGLWTPRPERKAAFSSLAPGTAIGPDALLMFSDDQFANRGAWNQSLGSNFHIVPERFDVDRAVHWTPMWSLTEQREVLVASSYIWFGHPDMYEYFFAAADANGAAAGNTLEEAILQGLLELVERDAVAIWWYNRLSVPEFDMDSLDEPWVEMVRRHYDRLDRDLWMLDITSDLGIPVCCAVSRRRSGPAEDLLVGFGAHVDPHTAALRALTELNQFLPAIVDVNPDGTTRYFWTDPEAIKWWTTQTLEGNGYLKPGSSAPTKASHRAGLASDDLATDVQSLVDLLAGVGCEVLVIDQTRPDIELSVAKVIVPGLRHFWRRLGPGRLYDVPVKLGTLDAPNREADLNPQDVFF